MLKAHYRFVRLLQGIVIRTDFCQYTQLHIYIDHKYIPGMSKPNLFKVIGLIHRSGLIDMQSDKAALYAMAANNLIN